jgi:putative ABC transport system permease protein
MRSRRRANTAVSLRERPDRPRRRGAEGRRCTPRSGAGGHTRNALASRRSRGRRGYIVRRIAIAEAHRPREDQAPGWRAVFGPGWLLGLRDLDWRRRRFLIAFVATGLVFSLALLMSGIKAGLDNEPQRVVDAFHADGWLVARGVSSPFSAPAPFPAAAVRTVRAIAGVRRADPVALVGGTIGNRNINVIGLAPGSLGSPGPAASRLLARGFAVADTTLGMPSGTVVKVGGVRLRIGALVSGLAYFGGTPALIVPLASAQRIGLGGQALTSAIVVQGAPRRLPPGLVELSNAQVRAGLARPVAGADQVITLIRTLLWVVAAGIIAAILYLSVLEQLAELAVLRAIGVSLATLLFALGIQAVVVSLLSGLLAVGLEAALAPAAGLEVSLSWASYASLFVVAIVVGALGSLVALRRVAGVDPAAAFGS